MVGSSGEAGIFECCIPGTLIGRLRIAGEPGMWWVVTTVAQGAGRQTTPASTPMLMARLRTMARARRNSTFVGCPMGCPGVHHVGGALREITPWGMLRCPTSVIIGYPMGCHNIPHGIPHRAPRRPHHAMVYPTECAMNYAMGCTLGVIIPWIASWVSSPVANDGIPHGKMLTHRVHDMDHPIGHQVGRTWVHDWLPNDIPPEVPRGTFYAKAYPMGCIMRYPMVYPTSCTIVVLGYPMGQTTAYPMGDMLLHGVWAPHGTPCAPLDTIQYPLGYSVGNTTPWNVYHRIPNGVPHILPRVCLSDGLHHEIQRAKPRHNPWDLFFSVPYRMGYRMGHRGASTAPRGIPW